MKNPFPILVIGDLHFPAACESSLSKMYDYIKTQHFKSVIQLGDIYDQYAQSRFPRKLNIFTPREETEISRRMGEEFWHNIHKHLPRAKKFQLSGNHDSERVKKKIIASVPELEHLFDTKALYEFDKVETLHDYRSDLELGGVCFTHGVFTRKGAHVRHYQTNVVHAHTHRAWLEYVNLKHRTIFEFCAGYLADPFHPFLQYVPLKKVSTWNKGFGRIDKIGQSIAPLFIPTH